MKTRIQKLIAFLAAAWRAGEDPPLPEAIDDLIRERLAELTLPEAIAIARVTALRDGERELAAALQAVLLLHRAGASLEPVTTLAVAEPTEETVH